MQVRKTLGVLVLINAVALVVWALWALSNGVGPGLIQETGLWTEAPTGFVLLTALVFIPNFFAAELARAVVAAIAPGRYWLWIGVWMFLLIPQWYLYIAVGRWVRGRLSRRT